MRWYQTKDTEAEVVKYNEPLADMLPPVAHPANTVFVVSCFALACTRIYIRAQIYDLDISVH
jgi:hypothetical protein